MTHTHAHAGHSHSHAAPDISPRVMAAAVIATLAFVVIEGICGWWAGSLALLSDAGHNMTDAAALALSWYALAVSKRPSHAGMTFGYHRVGVLAAMINSLTLVAIAIWIGWEALLRLRAPEPTSGAPMVIVAGAAILINAGIGLALHRASKHDINVRSAYLHMVGDAISALGVMLAGVVVAMTGSSLADPVVSLLIAGFILYSSYGVVRESATILLEGTPAGLEMPRVVVAIQSVAGVLAVHDLHVWMVGPGVVACSCHIVVAEQSVREGQQVLRAVVHELADRFHISHTTVQVEVEGCEYDDMYCGQAKAGTAGQG
jgi:cobalt-zinc-cadmium efflux system protein